MQPCLFVSLFIGQLEKQLSDMQKQNQSLQDETLHLKQQLEEAHLETSHLLERISQMQQTDEHVSHIDVILNKKVFFKLL